MTFENEWLRVWTTLEIFKNEVAEVDFNTPAAFLTIIIIVRIVNLVCKIRSDNVRQMIYKSIELPFEDYELLSGKSSIEFENVTRTIEFWK